MRAPNNSFWAIVMWALRSPLFGSDLVFRKLWTTNWHYLILHINCTDRNDLIYMDIRQIHTHANIQNAMFFFFTNRQWNTKQKTKILILAIIHIHKMYFVVIICTFWLLITIIRICTNYLYLMTNNIWIKKERYNIVQ